MNNEFLNLAEELKNLGNKPTIDIKISPLAAWCLIAQIQLASRHPANNGITGQHAKDIALALQSRIEMSEAFQQFTDKGWHQEYDAKSTETTEEFISRIPSREIVEVHNAYSLYQSDKVLSDGSIMMSRPQDWGNPNKWKLERFRFEWMNGSKHYINNAYCWYNPKKLSKGDTPRAFAPAFTTIFIPGDKEQLCSNRFLAIEDVWDKDWGEMPPCFLDSEGDDSNF